MSPGSGLPTGNVHIRPVHAGITEDWKALVYRTGQHGRQRVVRMAYEIITFQALRERALALQGDLDHRRRAVA